MGDSTAPVLFVFMIMLVAAAAVVAYQFYNVDKRAKEDKELVISHHKELGANIERLTAKLTTEVATLSKSDSGNAELVTKLTSQQGELQTLSGEVSARLEELESQGTVSTETLDKSVLLLANLSKAMQEVADGFDAFRTEQTTFNADVTGKLGDLSVMDERLDSEVKALKAVEGLVGKQETVTTDLTQKMNRFKFDDKNNAFYVCGVDASDCKQLAFASTLP